MPTSQVGSAYKSSVTMSSVRMFYLNSLCKLQFNANGILTFLLQFYLKFLLASL